MGVVDAVIGEFSSLYNGSLASQVLLIALILAVISLFIWQFYKSTSKRNLIRLDLRKYNYSDHPFASKLIAVVLYLLEYIIIMPLLIILWFAGLSVVLLLIARGRSVNEVLLISAAMIGAIRILAYVRGEIAKDLAKLFPFIALSIFLLSPGEFGLSEVFLRFSEIPSLFSNILSFVFVVVLVEIVLRVFYTIYDFWLSEEEVDAKSG